MPKIMLSQDKIKHYSIQCGYNNRADIVSRLRSARHEQTLAYRIRNGFSEEHAQELADLLCVSVYQLERDWTTEETLAGAEPK